MKIKRVFANNNKKSFLVDIGSRVYEFPYSELDFIPGKKDPLVSVNVEKDLGSAGFSYLLKSGKGDTVLLEQVLDFNRDPEVLRKKILYELTCLSEEALSKSKLTKRAIARRLNTTPTQIYRLLDQTFYGKTIDQMVKLLSVLGTLVEFRKVA